MKIKKMPLMAIVLMILFGLAGTTIAYYQTNNTFSNVFNSGKYVITTEETFESPDNWKPGDTTPKEIKVKNEGDVPAVVKVCLDGKWEDKDGNELPTYNDSEVNSVIINYTENYYDYWHKGCSINHEENCYYYNLILDPNEETQSLIESVTFNPDFHVEAKNDCTVDPVTSTTTCTSTVMGYGGGKYKLDINIETVQANQYTEAWENPSIENPLNESCENVEFRNRDLYHNTLMIAHFGEENERFFTMPINRNEIESLQIVDNKTIPNNVIGSYDVSYLKDESVIAWYTDNDNDELYEVYIGADGKVFANPDSSDAFSYLPSINTFDLEKLDISKVYNMAFMFRDFANGTDNFDLSVVSNWDVSNVTNMRGLFSHTGLYATNWSVGDLSNWNTGNVTDMSQMFSEAGQFVPSWNIGDLSNWNTSKVTTMDGMFFKAGTYSATWNIGNIGNWDTSNVTDMGDMFNEAGYNATTWSVGDLSEWDTSNVINMSGMFSNEGYNATTWNIGNIGNWDTSNVTVMNNMFTKSGYNATTWNIGNLSNWDIRKVNFMDNMFEKAGYNATTWNDIGTLNIHKASMISIFNTCKNAKATLNLHGNPMDSYPTGYTNAFTSAATVSGSGITVNYTSDTTKIDNIIATKSSNSNVVKGSIIN